MNEAYSLNRPLRADEIWLQESRYQDLKQAPTHPSPPLVCHHVINGIFLTPQEWCTAASLVKGSSKQDTAEHLALSPHTVQFYINTMMAKFSVSQEAELVQLLMHAGIQAAQR